MIKLRYTSILYHIVLHIMSSQAILQDSNVPATGDMLCVPGLGAPGCMKTGASATRCTYIPIYICAYLHTYIHTYYIHIGIQMHTYKHSRVDTCDVRGLTCLDNPMPPPPHDLRPKRACGLPIVGFASLTSSCGLVFLGFRPNIEAVSLCSSRRNPTGWLGPTRRAVRVHDAWLT